MKYLRRLALATCFIAVATNVSARQAPSAPSVVLLQIPEGVLYPPIAASARVTGTIDVRVGVRPDGTVADVTIFPQANLAWKLLQGSAVDAASRARFECRGCTQPSTPHTMTFVFSLDKHDDEGNPAPAEWKQVGQASSEIILFGHVTIHRWGPETSKPFHVRAARCLWLWRCSKQAYVIPWM
jgi:TonB family protein